MKTTIAFAKSSSRPGKARSPLRAGAPWAAAARTECAPYHAAFAICLAFAALCLLAAAAGATTNDLTSALQRGLFEEEANHNLNAAIAAYQSVAAQFDKDRKLAATAVFRLGECYRKEGDTNNAASQYERVLRDFSDQAQLVTLSRQNLAGLSAPTATSGEPALSNAARQEQKRLLEEEIKLVEQKLADVRKQVEVGAVSQDELRNTQRDILNLKRQLAALDAGQPLANASGDATASAAAAAEAESLALEAQVTELKSLPKEKLRIAVQQSFPNPVLTSLMQKLTEAEQSLAQLQKEYGPQHAEVLKAAALRDTASKQIDEQVEAVLRGLEIKRTAAKKTAETLLAQSGAATPKKEAAAGSANVAPTASEAEEVKRIQALIKDSPDLINAKDAGGSTPLHNAAAQGQLVVAQFLLENGADVDAKDSQGETPLHDAVRGGHKAMVELLLNHQAGVQTVDYHGATPLHLAAKHGYRSVVEVLLAHGADVNAKDRDGTTPLLMAAANGFRSVAELLLAHGADLNASTSIVYSANNDRFSGTALDVAARRGDPAMVELLLANKADLTAADQSGDTPLALAAARGDLAIASTLLSHGADVNAKNSGKERTGWSPLHWAVEANQKEMVALLLKSKADPNARIETSYGEGGRGYTPLLMATARVLPDIVDLLLASGADPNLGNDTRAPILNALNNENPAARLHILKALLQHDAAVEARDTQGNTPLLLAAWRADKDAMALLLANKADPNARDKNGRSALYLLVALSQDRDVKPLAELLLAAGADVNARNAGDGATPLHLAVERGKQELVELLLAHKADPNARDKNGQTPLNLAEHKGPLPGVPLSYQWQPSGQPGILSVAGSSASQAAPAAPPSMADLLRRHGASDDLPRLDCVELRRPSAKYSATIFSKGTNDWNQFSLMELIAVHYGFLAGNTAGESRQGGQPVFAEGLSFPDFAHLRLRQPSADLKSWKEKTIDLAPALQSGDCAADIRLAWGDVVEIPESDHPLDQSWPGFPEADFATLKKCLTRQVEIVIKGQSTNLTLAPDARFLQRSPFPVSPLSSVSKPAFWIKPVLRESGLLLASSDLSRVKVSRHDRATGQTHEWVLDCSDHSPAPDFWLRDGDRIDVPEKSPASSAAEAEAPERRYATQSAPYARNPVPPPAYGAPARSTFVQQLNRVLPRSPAAGPDTKPLLFEALPDAPTLKKLLEGGADPNVRTSDGTPLLVQAIRDRNQLAVELLLSHQAEVNAADSVGWTPLDYATADGLKAIVELLLKAGATVNARNPSGDTALHIAVRLGQRELAELLLANKADPNVRNNAGQTPPALAQSMGLSLGMGGARPRALALATPQAVEEAYLNIGGALYSPKPDDPELRKAGYHRDSSARTRQSECWEQRAEAELSGRAGNTIWTGTDMIEFGGEGMGTSFDDGARYSFAEDTWAALPQKGAPSSRTGHAAVWTGKEMIVWGGFGGRLGNDTNWNDGARYNPASDAWKPVTTKNAPAARFDFPAVWTGREMLVWGGFTDSHSRYQGGHADAHLDTGGRYAPSSDSWKAITTRGAPSKRWSHTLVWTGKEAIVWGGGNATEALNDGGRYSPARDSWRAVSADGAPSPRMGHVAFWTGKEMIVWGGTTREVDAQAVYFENGACYNPETDTWRPISTVGAPKGRISTTAVWTGTEMVVWGGVNDAEARGVSDSNRYVGTGARYNPATDTWTAMTLTGAPSPRLTSGVWTGEGLLIFGGYNGVHLNDTWFYSPSRTLYPYVKE